LKQASNKSWAVEAVLLKTGTGNKSKAQTSANALAALEKNVSIGFCSFASRCCEKLRLSTA